MELSNDEVYLHLTVSRNITHPSQFIGSSPAAQTCPHHLVLDQSLVLLRHTVRQISHKMSFVPYASNGLPFTFACLRFDCMPEMSFL